MTKRYYYTDPLAAAWMLKHFNLRIHTGGGDMCVITVDFPLNRYGEDFTSVGKKLYVNPDSLHILQPQVDDVIISDEGILYKICSNEEYKLHIEGSAVEDMYIEKETICDFDDVDQFHWYCEQWKTIQRNNTAFMWPEVEEINDEL